MVTCTSERAIDKHATHRSWLERRQRSYSTTLVYGSHMPNILSETMDSTDVSDGKDDDDDDNDNITEDESENDDDSDVD